MGCKRYLSLLVIVSKEFVGYLLAAIGPIALGKIYDVCHSWTMPLVLLLILALVLTVLGYLAGREKIINN